MQIKQGWLKGRHQMIGNANGDRLKTGEKFKKRKKG